MRLRHVDTGGYLHSHDKKYSRIAGGQQEVRSLHISWILVFWLVKLQIRDCGYVQVCGIVEKRPDNVWLAAEGVYLPVTETK